LEQAHEEQKKTSKDQEDPSSSSSERESSNSSSGEGESSGLKIKESSHSKTISDDVMGEEESLFGSQKRGPEYYDGQFIKDK
jgi:hypothetical protein